MSLTNDDLRTSADEPSEAVDAFGLEPGSGSSRTIRAPWHTSSVPLLRDAVSDDLRARGVKREVIDEAELVVSELVTNSLRHATPLTGDVVRVHWKARGDCVEVEVTDGGGATEPRPVPEAAWRTSGRGLRIVRRLAHEWGVNRRDRQVTVWAALGGPSRRRVGG
ncbi:ATP-binding protein [Janibacter sp. GXQ6167]|uniref:ATP-binding protein n=1 Tax=Janibacter sp. GXQ6167 TaxID=3240791 RepID=UPI003524EF1B